MRKLLVLTIALALLATVGCTSQTAAPSVKASPTSEQTVVVETTVKPTAAPPEETAVAATATPAVGSGFADQEVTLENVEAALSFLFMDGEYIGTDVTDSAGTVYVTIMYLPSSYTDETNFVAQVGLQAAMVMEILFSNPNVDVVALMGNTPTAEDIIEISLSKETAETVDWADMIAQAQLDYNAMLMVADNYHIDDSISDKLK